MNVTIIICTTRGPWEEKFKPTTTIKQLLEEIVKHFSFSLDGKYELRLKTDPDNSLAPDKTLENYEIKDGDTIVFTDFGVAV